MLSEEAIAGSRQGEGGAVYSRLPTAEVVSRLDRASRRGRLAGFRAYPGDGVLFSVELPGHPFDGVLEARAREEGGGTRLELRTRMLLRMPVVFALVLIATVWPGVYFMDRLIPGEWGWIPQIGTWWPGTWWWYVPLTALPLPFVWRALMRRSKAALDKAAEEMVAKIRRTVSDER
jgi:hypothetical protein